MISYLIGVSRLIVSETQVNKEYATYSIGFNVAEPYNMLNYIVMYDFNDVKAYISSLEGVVNGRIEWLEDWGLNEMVLIDSYKEKSIIKYDLLYNPLGHKSIEVPTRELLALMQDWALFLENNQIGSYEELSRLRSS